MTDSALTFSIIIPVKPGGQVAALAALRRLDFPVEAYEVLVTEGCRPSVQRNRAAEQASGELLYFLDDDSLVNADALSHIADAMRDPTVAVIGGPSVTPVTDTPFQRSISYALQSLLGGGGVRTRYRALGVRRRTDERELILCNLCFRRDLFLKHGGLDERLYPNEENELLDRLQAAGQIFLHDPQLAVQRSQRSTVRAFLRQMYGYGLGRGEQTRISRRLPLAALIPPLFFLYVLSLTFVHAWWYFLPLWLYLLLVLAAAGSTLLEQSVPGIGIRMIAIIPVMHLCYGAGIIIGTLAPRFRQGQSVPCQVAIRVVKRLGEPWSTEPVGVGQ